jgi:hypothetical protein
MTTARAHQWGATNGLFYQGNGAPGGGGIPPNAIPSDRWMPLRKNPQIGFLTPITQNGAFSGRLTSRPELPRFSMRDGLYRVVTSHLVAGFVIRAGQVVQCAPILRRKIDYWKTVATFIGP